MSEPLYYWDYLGLDAVLGAQELESTRAGAPAHDEMLFIVVHQAFELWFKQILWELGPVLEVMSGERVDERDMGRVVSHLTRITAIQPLLIDQLAVLETMTPLDFLDFRDFLVPASGFQSVQFRLIENQLGIDPEHRLKIKGARYTSRLSAEHAATLERSESEPSLLDALDRWLARTPFLTAGDFDFWREYRVAVDAMIERDRELIRSNPSLDEITRDQQLAAFETTVATFATLFDADAYEELRTRGKRRLSHRAFLAALFISLYRDEPICQIPFRLLTALVDIDEGFTTWRYRHAQMVHRMIGGRIGTGGTSGHEYLRAAAEKHKAFGDLFDLATFHIPRSQLPTLPPEIERLMDFRYTGREPA